MTNQEIINTSFDEKLKKLNELIEDWGEKYDELIENKCDFYHDFKYIQAQVSTVLEKTNIDNIKRENKMVLDSLGIIANIFLGILILLFFNLIAILYVWNKLLI